jgi:hypothetical protein
MDTSAKFIKTVMNRLKASDQFIKTIEWLLITAINVSLIVLVIALKHKEHVLKKPVRTIRKKKPIKRTVKKV